MIVKLLGALVIIFSCTGFGFSINAKNKLKINELKNMNDCLNIMEKEMCVSFKSLFDAIDVVICNSSKTNTNLFNKILNYRNNNENVSLSEKITDILSVNNKLYDSKDIAVLKGLSSIVGCENREMLKKNFEKLKLDLDNRISQLNDNVKNKAIAEKLSVYVGIIIVVFFI